MAEPGDVEKSGKAPSVGEASKTPPRAEDEVSLNAGDNAILPEGQIDPVYEKKAKILNRAVSHYPLSPPKPKSSN